MLNKLDKNKERKPIGPAKFLARQYIRKVPMIAASTFLSLLAFGPALLVFDFVVLIAYLFGVIISIIFGILEMKHVEEYYTVGLLEYAEWRVKNEENMEEICRLKQVDMGSAKGLEDVRTVPCDLSDLERRGVGSISDSSDNG